MQECRQADAVIKEIWYQVQCKRKYTKQDLALVGRDSYNAESKNTMGRLKTREITSRSGVLGNRSKVMLVCGRQRKGAGIRGRLF